MTIHTRLLVCSLLLLGLLGLAFPPTCESAPEPLPEGVVAIVSGRHLTTEGFYIACAQQAHADIKRQRGGPRSVLEQLIEEVMVRQECKRLGITVAQAEVDRLWRDIDTRLKVKSNGAVTLLETIKREGNSRREFVEQLWHLIRKERIAQDPQYLGPRLPKNEAMRLNQIGIVIGTVRRKTDVKYGVTTIDHIQQNQRPAKLAPGVVATVSGAPITEAQFGKALVVRLSSDKVREYLDRECKTALMSMEGVKLSDADLKKEVDHLRELWPLQRELLREEVWRTVSFKDRFETQFNMTVKDVKNSRYSRGLLGLVRRMRATTTEAELLAAYERDKKARYGEHILVHDIRITFAQKKGLIAGRSLREAIRLAGDIVRRQGGGVSFEKIAADINRRQDRTYQAHRLRLFDTDRDLVLYNHAARMRDGNVSSPFETLSEVHVTQRVGLRPARSFAEVRPDVVESLARRKAKNWISDRIKDPKYVRLRWPLSERK